MGLRPPNASLDAAGHVPQGQLLRSSPGLYALTQRASTRAIFSAQDRSALYDATTGNVVVMYLGDQRGLYVQVFNATTKARGEPVRISDVRASLGFEDNHGVPSMAMDANGYYHVLYGAHNLFPIYTRSTNPHDASSWTVPVALGVGSGTYHSAACDRVNNKLYVVFRAYSGSGDGHAATYPGHEFAGLLIGTVAGDGTVTWSEVSGGIIDTTGYSAEAKKDAYVAGCDFVGGKLRMSMAVAHGPVHDSIRSDVFHLVYNPTTAHMETPAGGDLGVRVDSLADLTACRVQQVNFVAGLKHAFKSDGTGVICWNQYDQGTTLAADTFAGAGAAADLNTHVATTGGQAWARATVGNAALLIDGTGDSSVYTTDTAGIATYLLNYTPSSPDYAVEFDFNVKSIVAGWFANFFIRHQNDAGGTALIGALDGTNVYAQKVNSGSTTFAQTAFALIAGKTGTLRLEVKGKWIWVRVELTDGTFASVRWKDQSATQVTAAGKIGLRLRQGSTSTGFHVTGVRVYDKGTIQVWTAHFDGSAWARRDSGYRNNHAFYQPAVRLREDSGFELFSPTGRTDEPTTTHGQETQLGYLDMGADISMQSSADGVTWTDKGIVIPSGLARGQWWNGGQVPLDAPRDAKLLCLPAGVGYGTLDGYPTSDLGLYLFSDENVDPLAVARYWVRPGAVEQYFDDLVVLSAVTPASVGTWTQVDLSTFVPPNCTRVWAKMFGTGNGTANTQSYIVVREYGTARSEDIVGYGNTADTFVASTSVQGWVPVGANRQIEYKSSGLANSSLGLQLLRAA